MKSNDSLPKLADNLVSETINLLRVAQTEEDLRIGFETLLKQLKKKLNLNSTPKFSL